MKNSYDNFLLLLKIWCRLYHVFGYIYSLLIEKDICDCQNVSVYVYVTFYLEISSFFQ
jgi:hypothetical protein